MRAFRSSTAAAGVALLSAAILAATAVRAADLFIHQHNLHFSQGKVAVRVGDTLTFTNEDDVIHNIGVRGGDDVLRRRDDFERLGQVMMENRDCWSSVTSGRRSAQRAPPTPPPSLPTDD